MLGIGRGARAEGAADIDHVDAHLVGRDTQHDRQRIAHRGAALMAAADLVALGRRVVRGERAARLHRVGRDARAFERHADDAIGARDRRRRLRLVAILEIEADIAGNGVVELRGARARARRRSR